MPYQKNAKKTEKKLLGYCYKSKSIYICTTIYKPYGLSNARVAQLVEHNLAKVGVASSNLVSRSFNF